MSTTLTLNALLLTGCLMGIAATAQAKDYEADMAFRGTLIIPPPCTINDDNRIDVDFGERVGINKVDGVNYRQQINYQIDCEGEGSGNWVLTLSLLSGNVANFDPEALQTNKTNLGIRVYQNDKSFTPNSTLKIDRDNRPRLEAVPVMKPGATLDEGAFEAWATLRADYQ
ncbi:fimbrial protein [Serratia fonticola]